MLARIEDIKWDTTGQVRDARGLCYVIVHIWPSRADFAAGKPPAEIQDFRMQIPAKAATEKVALQIGGLYQLIGGGQWTQAEFDVEYLVWRKGKRQTNPRDEIIYNVSPVSHAAIIEANVTRYLDNWKLAPTAGDKRDLTLSLAARDEPGGIVDKADVQALIRKEIER